MIFMLGLCSAQAQILREGTLENIRYFLLEEVFGSFEESKEACILNDGVISVIDNLQKFEFIQDLVSDTDVNFYIGLKRISLTESFDFVDGLEDNNKNFFLTPFQLPWVNSQPNNFFDEEKCVAWFELGWLDVKCTGLNSIICRRECGGDNENLIVSECFNEEFEIVFIRGSFPFKAVVEQCDLVEAKVARVKNLDEFNQINVFLSQNNFESVYVGLQRLFTFNILDPGTFSFNNDEDEAEDKSFFNVTSGTFPWGVIFNAIGERFPQPNNDNLAEECVEWRLKDNLWFDEPCSESKRVLCQRTLVEEQTITPTFNPTKLPSLSPSLKPNEAVGFVSSLNPIELKVILLIMCILTFVLFLISFITLINKACKLTQLESLYILSA